MPNTTSRFPSTNCMILGVILTLPRFALAMDTDSESASPTDSPAKPAAEQPLTVEELVYDDDLSNTVQDAINITRRRVLDTDVHTPWQIMHGLLALRHDFKMKKNGAYINGLRWVTQNPVFDNEQWFEVTEFGGRAHPYSRPYAFEGHANQFFAILSMSGLPTDFEFQAGDHKITIADMIHNAKMDMKETDEPTWSLWALSRYLPPDARWLNRNGEEWSIERLVSMQTKAPVDGTACGGTHGLFALAHARNVYLRSLGPDENPRGIWLEADYKIRRYIEIARAQQNMNGSFSSDFFRGRAYDQDINDRMASAGHLLEFLMISLPQDRLKERWVRAGVYSIARDLIVHRRASVKCSPLYHSLSGLVIYLERTESKFRDYQVARITRLLDDIQSPATPEPAATSAAVAATDDESSTEPEPVDVDADPVIAGNNTPMEQEATEEELPSVTAGPKIAEADDAAIAADNPDDAKDLSEARPKQIASSPDDSKVIQ